MEGTVYHDHKSDLPKITYIVNRSPELKHLGNAHLLGGSCHLPLPVSL